MQIYVVIGLCLGLIFGASPIDDAGYLVTSGNAKVAALPDAQQEKVIAQLKYAAITLNYCQEKHDVERILIIFATSENGGIARKVLRQWTANKNLITESQTLLRQLQDTATDDDWGALYQLFIEFAQITSAQLEIDKGLKIAFAAAEKKQQRHHGSIIKPIREGKYEENFC